MIVVRYLTRILASCLLLLSVPLVPATSVHAASASPIFPPASAFVLPASVAGAKVAVTTATSSNNQPPTNAVAQAHYQFSHQHIAFEYDVTTFHSVQDATSRFAHFQGGWGK